MTTLVRNKASLAWSVLVVLTLAQWMIGSQIAGGGPHVAACLVIFVVAVFKARLVGLYFMELRSAPWALRCLFELYCVALLGVLSVMYLFG
ncbi:MAG TPA: cytochrome C oxidase subunit IV family protein [Mycobacterium sp.]|jgi:caa(3)-type oxidase subunit IV|uniref:cytochrome C oxidase subunit IV family protein n=1 Tax=Mycobacterium sp. TaxID=1785 RepID=UPI002B76E21B|nr:cytochrome C oxidase subunit IV family protein [Mycobacterium sp.]HME76979.1 cytochrome C oxidase subunit IV family protein [Mycobacterium sp.]